MHTGFSTQTRSVFSSRRTSPKRLLPALILGLCLPLAANAHDVGTLPELMKTFQWDPETTEIKVETLGKGFHVLFGLGGNIAVSIGDQGVLVVDDQFPSMMPKILAAIEGLGGSTPDFAINTHWHFDHAEGNQALGPKGTWLVSQVNSRNMLLNDHTVNLVFAIANQPAYPKDALPVITYDRSMQFFFNGERIDLMHTGPAHTTGDTAIIFRGQNAVHLGDVFNNSGYPFIDADNGGSLEGMIAFCTAVLEATDADTTVIPGHGPVTDHADLAAYVQMLSTVRDRILKLIASGASMAEVMAAKPTAEFDGRHGDPAMFLNRAYTSLLRGRAQ